MSNLRTLRLDPSLLQSPGAPLFRLASQASAVARLVADDPLPSIRAGWYLFDAGFTPGAQDATQLVVDYGEGFAWLERLSPRHPDAQGAFHSVIAIKREPRDFGLLAGRDGNVPALRTASLRPIGRMRALLEMLRGIHASAPRQHLAVAAAAAWLFLQALPRLGRKGAATLLVERYEAISRGMVNDYAAWLVANPDDHRDDAPYPAYQPRVSVLMHLDPARWAQARRSLNSVLSQPWSRWQLCIAHPRAMPPVMMSELRAVAAGDPRIALVPFEDDSPSQAWAAALTMATGDYCARLACGDQLSTNALRAVANAIVQHPAVGLIYSDHDAIDDAGQRCDPEFKQDWSPDLSCRREAMLYLAVIDRAILSELGAYAGGDAFDVVLRASEACGADRIVHIPRVLYHRVTRQANAADDADGVRALQAHLYRQRQRGQVSLVAQGTYRVAYPLPDPVPLVEVLVPTRDQRKLLARCVEGLLERTRYPNLRVRIIDNDSRDKATLELLERLAVQPRVTLRNAPGAFNFSRIMNQAARESGADVLCLLNDDVIVLEPDWLEEMVSQALRPGIGAVGAMLHFPDGSLQHGGVVTGVGGVAGHVHYCLPRDEIASSRELSTVRNYTAVTAACMVVKRDRFMEVGGFDEGLPVCYNDVDFCLRLRELGYFNLWTPFATLAHHESATRGPDDTPVKRARHQREFARMLARWGDRLNRDPAYNPNLSLYGEPFELARAPRTNDDLRPSYPSQRPTRPINDRVAERIAERASHGHRWRAGAADAPTDSAGRCASFREAVRPAGDNGGADPCDIQPGLGHQNFADGAVLEFVGQTGGPGVA